MSELRGAMIIGQSGGPSSVINASCYGAIKAGLDSDAITKGLRRCQRHRRRADTTSCT